jgi:SAM-dependent methyltransferase
MDASEWDARYSSADLVWGTEPNRFVAAELADLPPGRALDVACGEGRNAIWLARRGWFAVGVDFSAAGIDRARQLAESAAVGDRTSFVVGDVAAGPLPTGPFDAVIVAYLQLAVPERTQAIRMAADQVAAGGVLLVVGHDATNLSDGFGGPQDHAVLFTPDDIVADIGDGLMITKAERVRRPVDTPDGERIAIDALVLATRSRQGA